ncbi:hypothetical protein CPB83DRAFT_896385 [Crepidotus variabilis]|uniref:Meiotically up-regulated protein Msb1/Mug8 domain-containing protein n=1 Tax=Crepidotus variabilis TaxID=179855 RepID=A0A9P6ECF1_9AGAR|nr:hypothetical protein CPB83DRAFT_896385 [Crepidotus variabilis]
MFLPVGVQLVSREDTATLASASWEDFVDILTQFMEHAHAPTRPIAISSMPSFLSKVFGRKNHEHDHDHEHENAETSHVTSPLSPGELLEGRFEAISPNVSPSATRFDLDSTGKPLSGNGGGKLANSRPGRVAVKDKDKDINVFGLFKAKSRPSSPEVQHRRLLDTLPHLKLDFEHSHSTGKGEPSSSIAANTTADFLQADSVLSDAVIGQRRLNPLEALVLIRACSKVITARGLETLGIMTPHWYSASPDTQRRLISLFLNSSSSAATNNGHSPSAAPVPVITLSPSTALSSTASPSSSFEDELNFTRSIHDVAAVLRWGLRHLQLDNGSFGTSEGEEWYQSFISSEAEANYPPKAFSQHLAVSGKVPTQHLELLVATLEIFSSLAAFSETNGTSGSKLSKIFGLWLLTGPTQFGEAQDWRALYERWERTGRILEHLFLARIRDESTDRRMPTRLLELVRKYPYTQGLSPPSTDRHITSGLFQRPQFTTSSHDALYVRIAYELPSTTTGTSKQKHKHKHRIHPSTLIADALSSSVSPSTSFSPSSTASSPTNEEFIALWQIITSTAQRVGTEAPLSSVFADDTIRLLKLVGEKRKEGRKTPAFELLKSIAAQSPASAGSKKGDPTSALLSPLALNINPKTNGGANGSASWEHFSTSGFESSVPPLASTLFDTDVERTEPPSRVESPSGVSRKLSGKWGPRKSGEVQRVGAGVNAGLVAPKMELVNSSSSGQSGVSNASNSSNSNGASYFNANPNGENSQALRPRRTSSLAIKPSHMSIIQLDEAFVDFWSDALLDPVSKDWPTFVICKFKKGVVEELAFGGGGQGSTSQEVAEGNAGVESEDSKGKAKETDKKETKQTVKYLVLEQVFTVRSPTPPSTPGVTYTAPPLQTAQSETAMSPVSPQSAKKRFSFWNPVSRSASTSSVGSLKGRKTPVQKVGELGELGEVVEEEGAGTVKGSGKDKQRTKSPTPTSTPPKKKRKSFDISDLGLKIVGKDKEAKEKEKDRQAKEKEKDREAKEAKETQKEVQKDEVQVPATIPKETPDESTSSTAKVAAVAASAVAAGAVVPGIVTAILPSEEDTVKPMEEAKTEEEVGPAEELKASEEVAPTVEDEDSKSEIPEREGKEATSKPKVEAHDEEITPKQEDFPAAAAIEPSVEEDNAAAPSIPHQADKEAESIVEERLPSAVEESTMASPAVEKEAKTAPIVEFKNIAPSASAPVDAQHPVEPEAVEEVAIPKRVAEPEVHASAEDLVDFAEPSQHVESPPVVDGPSLSAAEVKEAQEQETPSITIDSVKPKPVDDEADDALGLDKSSHVPLEPEVDATKVKDTEVEGEVAPVEAEASPEATYKEDVEITSEPAVETPSIIVDSVEPKLVDNEANGAIELDESTHVPLEESDATEVEGKATPVEVEASPEPIHQGVDVPTEPAVEETVAVDDAPVEEEGVVIDPSISAEEGQVILEPAPEAPAEVVEVEEKEAVAEPPAEAEEINVVVPEVEEPVVPEVLNELAATADGPVEEETPVEPSAVDVQEDPAQPSQTHVEETDSSAIPQGETERLDVADGPINESVSDKSLDTPVLEAETTAPEAESSVEEPLAVEEAIIVPEVIEEDTVAEVNEPHNPEESDAAVFSATTQRLEGDNQDLSEEAAIPNDILDAPVSEVDAAPTVAEPAIEEPAAVPIEESEVSKHPSNAEEGRVVEQVEPEMEEPAAALVSSEVTPAPAADDESSNELAEPSTEDVAVTSIHEEPLPVVEVASEEEPSIQTEPVPDTTNEHPATEDVATLDVDPVLIADDTIAATEAEDDALGRVAPAEHHEVAATQQEDETPQTSAPPHTDVDLSEPQVDEADSSLIDSVLLPDDKVASAEESIESQPTDLVDAPEVPNPEVAEEADRSVHEEDQPITENEQQHEAPVEQPKESEMAIANEHTSSHTEEPLNVVEDAVVDDQHRDTSEPERIPEDEVPIDGEEPTTKVDSTSPEPVAEQEAAGREETQLHGGDKEAPVEVETNPVEEEPALPTERSVEQEEAQPEVETARVEPSQESKSIPEEPEPTVAEVDATGSGHDDTLTPQHPEADPAQLSEPPTTVEGDQDSPKTEESTASIVSNEPHTEPVAIPEDTSKEALVELPPVPVIETEPTHEPVDTVTVSLPEPEPSSEEVYTEAPAAGEHSKAAEHVIESGLTPGPQLTLSTGEETDVGSKPEESLTAVEVSVDEQVPQVVKDAGTTEKVQVEAEVAEEPPTQEDPTVDDDDNGLGGAHPHIENLDAILAKLSAEGANENDSIAEDREDHVELEDESPALPVVDDTSAKDEVLNEDAPTASDKAKDTLEQVAEAETVLVHNEDESDEKADSEQSKDDHQHAKAGTEESDKTVVVLEAAKQLALEVEDTPSKTTEPVTVADLEPSVLVEED